MTLKALPISLLLLTAAGCASTHKGQDEPYTRVVDACTLLGAPSVQRYVGDGAKLERSPAPAPRSGNKQSVCSWSRATSGGASIYLAESFYFKKNGGAASASKAFKFGLSSCSDEPCRRLRGIGSEAYITGNFIGAPSPSPADGSIDVHVRDANLEFTISYLPGVDKSSPTIGPNVTANATVLAKEALNNLRKTRQHR